MSFEVVVRRAEWIDGKRAVAYPVLFLCVYSFIILLWVSGSSLFPEHKGVQFSRDFVNVYAAGLAVREGKAAEVYDWELQEQREHNFEASGKGPPVEETYVPWLYPPPFLAVAGGLAGLSYYPALAVFFVGGFLAYGAGVLALAPSKKAWAAIVAFPAVYANLFVGQNGFLTAAFLAAGLAFLETYPLAAGVAFGFLVYKPQFFVLIPLVLAAGRAWKALFASLFTAGVLCALSWAAFGTEAWLGFLRGLPQAQREILECGTDRWLGIMHTVFSAVRMFGGGIGLAYVIHGATALMAVFSVVYLWRRGASLAVRGASLAAAMLLVSPYSFNYDQVILAVPLALLAGEGIKRGFLPYEKLFLFLLWLLPALVKDYGERYAFPLTPPMLALLMAFCWSRTKRVSCSP